jgi:hypothetical protein
MGLACGLKQWFQPILGLKPLKPQAKINLSPFKLFLSGICHSSEKLTNTEN